MKKVLIISSSPRKGGNSDLLCDRFAEGAKEAGNEVEKIRLAEKPVNPCRACCACKKLHSCVQKDAANEIVGKMKEADILVLATPVYFYSVSAQLKSLIDRTFSAFPGLTKKTFYWIVTMGDKNSEMFASPLAALRGFLACCDGSTEAGAILAPGVIDAGKIRETPFFDQAYEMGKQVK